MKQLQPPALPTSRKQKKTAPHWLTVASPNPEALALVPRRHHGRHISPREEVGDLQGQGCPVAILLLDQVAHLIMDADAEAPVDVKLLEEPLHGDQHEVQVVDG